LRDPLACRPPKETVFFMGCFLSEVITFEAGVETTEPDLFSFDGASVGGGF